MSEQEFVQEVTEEQDNAINLGKLLDTIRNATITERDKGTRFETLIKDYLTKEPTYKDLFTKVQTYAEWAGEHPEFAASKKDLGIDLVATNVGGGNLVQYNVNSMLTMLRLALRISVPS